MREKLEKIISAYEDLEAKLGEPEVVSNQKEYVRLMKEHAKQADLVAKAREYVAADDDLQAAKEILRSESDPEMKAFAQEEISEQEDSIAKLEEEIKIMLIPGDPNDDKDIIVEIRSGAGGGAGKGGPVAGHRQGQTQCNYFFEHGNLLS